MDDMTRRDEPRPTETASNPGKGRFRNGFGTGIGMGVGIAVGVASVLAVLAIFCFILMGRGCMGMDGSMMSWVGATELFSTRPRGNGEPLGLEGLV